MVTSPVRFALRQSVIKNIINSPFSPRRLSNLAIWLDAIDFASLTFNVSTISDWRNKGNQGVGNAVQTLLARQPLYVANGINGRPALRGRHDGVNASQLDIADHPALRYAQFTIYAVYLREVDLGAPETIGGKYIADGTNRREHWAQINGGGTPDTLNLTISQDGSSSSLVTVNGAVAQTLNVPRIARFQYSGTQLQVQTLGASEATLNFSGTIVQTTSKYTLFSRPEFAAPFAGLIGEYLLFTRSLSATQRTQIETYLINKWGIA